MKTLDSLAWNYHVFCMIIVLQARTGKTLINLNPEHNTVCKNPWKGVFISHVSSMHNNMHNNRIKTKRGEQRQVQAVYLHGGLSLFWSRARVRDIGKAKSRVEKSEDGGCSWEVFTIAGIHLYPPHPGVTQVTSHGRYYKGIWMNPLFLSDSPMSKYFPEIGCAFFFFQGPLWTSLPSLNLSLWGSVTDDHHSILEAATTSALSHLVSLDTNSIQEQIP